jgi:hypothetical protein
MAPHQGTPSFSEAIPRCSRAYDLNFFVELFDVVNKKMPFNTRKKIEVFKL